MSSDGNKTDRPGKPGAGEEAPGWTRREMKGIPASLGALWTRREPDGWHYAIKLDQSHANAQGFVHGGVLMTFMDHALSLLVWEASGRARCATLQLDSHFLTAMRPPAFVELDGKVLKMGRKLAFAEGTLRANGVDVVKATGVWSVDTTTGPAASPSA